MSAIPPPRPTLSLASYLMLSEITAGSVADTVAVETYGRRESSMKSLGKPSAVLILLSCLSSEVERKASHAVLPMKDSNWIVTRHSKLEHFTGAGRQNDVLLAFLDLPDLT